VPPVWPLVGRHEELELIERAMGRPPPAGVVLAGAAGVGKTRLALEALEIARSRGLVTRWAAATHASGSLPFGPLTHLLPERIGAPARPGFLRTAARALDEGTGGRRLALGIDDAHLLDESSAALVHHLASSDGAFLVISVRTGEPAPDAIVALWKDGLTERLELQPLSREQVEQLVGAVLGGPVEGAAHHVFWKISEGNPQFLRELIQGGLEIGSLVHEFGVWRVKGQLADSPRLVDTVERRIGSMDDGERATLEVVAAGEPLELPLLDPVASRGDVERLERRGLLEVSTDRRREAVRFSHPIYGEVVRNRTGTLRARSIQRLLADGLERTGARRREDLLRLATWRLDGGGGPPGLFLQASRRALWYFDYVLARRLAEGSMEAGGGVPAGHALSEALIGLGRFREADDLLVSLERASRSEGERVQIAIGRARNLFWHMGEPTAALRVITRAEAEGADRDLRDELVSLLAEIQLFGGRVDDAIETVSELLSRTDASPSVLVHASMTIGWGLDMTGRLDEVPTQTERGRAAAAEATGFPFGFAVDWLNGNLAFSRFLAGDTPAGNAEMERAYRAAMERNAEPVRAVLAFGLGFQESIGGKPRTALLHLREAAAYFREIDLFRHLSSTLGTMAFASALLGDVEAAEAALGEAEERRIDAFRMDEGFIGLGRVWTTAARGEVSKAQVQGLDLAERMREMGMRVFEAIALHDVARLGQPAIVERRSIELADRMDGRLFPCFAAHASALASGDAGALGAVADRFEEMGITLFAAEAWAEAARAHRDAGRSGSSLAAAARARGLVGRCEDATTPALAQLEVPLPLTSREREVASLAATGLTNHQIADRLVVSIRTVDNHLHHVYTKLGVAGRAELVRILRPRVPASSGS